MRKISFCLIVLLAMVFAGCATNKLQMKNVNLELATASKTSKKEGANKINMLVLPHESLGLRPTSAIRQGNISVFMTEFPLQLFGEYFPGRLRWNSWTILPDGTERFGQVIFVGVHPSGYYYGVDVIDGQISAGQTVILSSAMDYIYSPLGKELKIKRQKFLADPAYRKKKIKEANKIKGGKTFNLDSLYKVTEFQDVIKSWNQIQYPEGYLLSPYGIKEVAKIRGINPRYSYFQKLVGTGKFRISPIPEPITFAISNSIGIVMDMINAKQAPSTGWDFDSQISRRQMAFVMKYLLNLAQCEVQKRNIANAKILEALSVLRRKP